MLGIFAAWSFYIVVRVRTLHLNLCGYMRLSVVFLILLCTAAHAADLVVGVTETKTGREKFFRIETDSLSARRIQAINSEALVEIARYKIEKGKLITGDQSLMKAETILFQCSWGDRDFVVVRQEYNSFCSPLRVLAAISGHPIQVSKIVIVKIAGGKVAARKELTRRASSYYWTATISQ